MQHAVPQHVAPAMHWIGALHGGAVQVWPLQNSAESGHLWPQPPQLLMSFSVLTHWLLQHVVPSVQAIVHTAPPLPPDPPLVPPIPLTPPLPDPPPLPSVPPLPILPPAP